MELSSLSSATQTFLLLPADHIWKLPGGYDIRSLQYFSKGKCTELRFATNTPLTATVNEWLLNHSDAQSQLPAPSEVMRDRLLQLLTNWSKLAPGRKWNGDVGCNEVAFWLAQGITPLLSFSQLVVLYNKIVPNDIPLGSIIAFHPKKYKTALHYAVAWFRCEDQLWMLSKLGNDDGMLCFNTIQELANLYQCPHYTVATVTKCS